MSNGGNKEPVRVCYITNVGKFRYRNEDSILVNGKVIAKTSMNAPECEEFSLSSPSLFAVADGMGGHACGDEASRLVLEFLKDKYPEDAEGVIKLVKETKEFLDDYLLQGNEHCYGMGTALAGVYLYPNKEALIFNVGDCRVYRFRNGNLELLSRDHTFIFRLYEEGKLDYEELRKSPERNILESAIIAGYPDYPEVFVKKLDIEEKDKVLICSDGLWESLSFKEMVKCLEKELKKSAKCLFELSYLEGRDNISFILLELIP